MRIGLFILILFSLSAPLSAQIPDTLVTEPGGVPDPNVGEPLLLETPDSNIDVSRAARKLRRDSLRTLRRLERATPNPKKAMFLSLALPGSGQIYNGQWWKAPIVYAGIGGAIYNIQYNTRFYRRFRTAYLLKIDDQPHEFSANARLDNESVLLNYRNQFDKRVQEGYLLLIGAYGLQVLEAFVAAHLKDFDTSDDIGLRLQPATEIIPGYGTSFGVGVVIPLSR